MLMLHSGIIFADCIKQMGYTSCLADSDLWIKVEVRPDDGEEYNA